MKFCPLNIKFIVYFLIFYGLNSCQLFIPKTYRNYFSDDPWKKIHFESGNPTIRFKELNINTESDSIVILRSNRVFHPERQKFLGDYIDSNNQSKTFLIAVKKGHFYVFQTDILTGLSQTTTSKNLVVYVEGMGKNFYLAATRAIAMSAQYKVQVVMMDYPSINNKYGIRRNFRFARRNSFKTAPYLLQLLKDLQEEKNKKNEWTKSNWTLFHHSMGNIMLRRILRQHSDSVISPELFDLVVLNAACTEEKQHYKWLEKSHLGKKHIVNYNKDDRQLNGAQFLTLKRQLGSNPKRHHAKNATYVDFNPLVGPRHSTFAVIPLRPPLHPHAVRYYKQIFNGEYPDFTNRELFGTLKSKQGYYVK